MLIGAFARWIQQPRPFRTHELGWSPKGGTLTDSHVGWAIPEESHPPKKYHKFGLLKPEQLEGFSYDVKNIYVFNGLFTWCVFFWNNNYVQVYIFMYMLRGDGKFVFTTTCFGTMASDLFPLCCPFIAPHCLHPKPRLFPICQPTQIKGRGPLICPTIHF